MYLLEKDYKDRYSVERKLFKDKKELFDYIEKNIETIFNAGFHSAEIRLNRVEVEGE